MIVRRDRVQTAVHVDLTVPYRLASDQNIRWSPRLLRSRVGRQLGFLEHRLDRQGVYPLTRAHRRRVPQESIGTVRPKIRSDFGSHRACRRRRSIARIAHNDRLSRHKHLSPRIGDRA
jgi:hypothetical protein